MKAKTCVPIRDCPAGSLQQTIDSYLRVADSVEIWLEDVEPLSLDAIAALAISYGERLLFLFRQGTKEARYYSFTDRMNIYGVLAATEAQVDCDLHEFPEDLEALKNLTDAPAFICSYHNFEETPSDEALEAVVTRMEAYGPTVYKLACFCNTHEDAYRLLGLLLRLRSEGKRSIVLGMGQAGMITRFAGSIWGNELIFTPTPESIETAPGQIQLEDMKRFYRLVGE